MSRRERPSDAAGPVGLRRPRRGGAAVRAALLALCLSACRKDPAPRIGVVMGAEGSVSATLASATLRASSDPALAHLTLRTLAGRFNTDARSALFAAESLANDPGVVAVVGHSNSAASIAASQVYNARHVVQIAPTSTSPLYGQAGPFSFRLVGGDSGQAEFIAAQVVAGRHARVAIVNVNDEYGRALRVLVRAALEKRGIRPVYEGAYVEAEPVDVENLTASIARARPSLLLWLGREQQWAALAPALTRAAPALAVLASDGFGSPDVMRDARHRYGPVRFVRLVDVAHAGPPLTLLRQRFREVSGGELTDQAALSYDAILLLAEAVRAVGPDREAIREWLASLGRTRPAYQGVTGPIAFSKNGDREGSYSLATAGAAAGSSAP